MRKKLRGTTTSILSKKHEYQELSRLLRKFTCSNLCLKSWLQIKLWRLLGRCACSLVEVGSKVKLWNVCENYWATSHPVPSSTHRPIAYPASLVMRLIEKDVASTFQSISGLSYRFPIFETSATALCGTTGIWLYHAKIDYIFLLYPYNPGPIRLD